MTRARIYIYMRAHAGEKRRVRRPPAIKASEESDGIASGQFHTAEEKKTEREKRISIRGQNPVAKKREREREERGVKLAQQIPRNFMRSIITASALRQLDRRGGSR